MTGPNKDEKFPLEHYNRLCFLKNIVKNPNIIVGDYTYYDDFENVENFEKNVKYLFDFVDRQPVHLSVLHIWKRLGKSDGGKDLPTKRQYKHR